MGPIPDHLQEGLAIVFVGYNPSLRSGESGHHYANPRNRFWRVLFDAGLTPRFFRADEDGELLKLGIGFTNIVSRPTRTAAEITAAEYAEGRTQLRAKMEHFRPAIVCYVGKGVYEAYTGRKGMHWGRQLEAVVPGTVDYVVPSTSGLVRMSLDELTAHYRGLQALRLERQGKPDHETQA